MLKLWRLFLFWLARMAGIVGLAAGGKSLGTYLLARLRDPYFDSFSYNDILFSGGVIFLLSLLVLIFAEVGHSLAKNLRSLPLENSGTAVKTAVLPVRPAELSAPASMPRETEVEQESADEKLARLLKQKNEQGNS